MMLNNKMLKLDIMCLSEYQIKVTLDEIYIKSLISKCSYIDKRQRWNTFISKLFHIL